MKNIFAWLDDADETIGDGGAHRAYWAYADARDRDDPEAVRVAVEHMIHLGEVHQIPWLGVFARHWHLQYRLNDRSEGLTAVADTTMAFELAHREENLDCPQTICTTQDLSIAYTRTDGPGYADEVIAACNDTLERIDPSWPCFDCVSAELRSALINAGRHEQALELIDGVQVEIRSAGAKPTIGYEIGRLRALLALGRDAEALAVVDALKQHRFAFHTDAARPSYELAKARVLLRAGRDAEALGLFADAPSVLNEPSLSDGWMRAADELMDAGLLANDDEVAGTKVRLAHLLHRRGAIRSAFDVAVSAAHAAATRGAVSSARRAADLASTISGQLARPTQVDVILTDLRAAIDLAPSTVADTAPLDERVEELEQRRAGGTLDASALTELTSLLAAQGWEHAAVDLLWEHTRSHPSDTDAAMQLLALLLEDRDARAVAELAALLQPVDPAAAHWCAARLAAVEDRWDDAAASCSEIIALHPDRVNTRRLWAMAARRLGDFPSAARLSAEILDLTDDEPSDQWAAVVHGSLAEDWPLVRRAGALIGMVLEGDGPIREEWEHCLITFLDDDGVQRTHTAVRTGPATARIVSVAHPEVVQHHGDDVVFEPRPLDPVPENPDNAQREPFRYESITTTSLGGYRSHLFEGALRSPEHWITLRDGLYDAGFPIWAFEGGHTDLPDGTEVEVLAAAVGLGPNDDAERLAATIEHLTTGWDPQPSWISLAEETGRDGDEHRRREHDLWG